jgi:hypothetical protein
MQYLINARMKIWQAKELGKSPPYSTDPILNKFRFCNIYRELDRQTIEIHSKYLDLRENFPLWLLNVAFARFICRTQTINTLDIISFSHPHNLEVKNKLLKLNYPKYGNAYVFPISVLKGINCPNRETFLCEYLPSIMENVAAKIRKFKDESVLEVLPEITKIFGSNLKFHLTEILIDVAYQFPQFLNLYRQFPIGPGSRPAMKLLCPNLEVETTCAILVNQLYSTRNLLTLDGQPILLSAENWEGVGCEYRKYANLLSGRGRHRLYKFASRL